MMGGTKIPGKVGLEISRGTLQNCQGVAQSHPRIREHDAARKDLWTLLAFIRNRETSKRPDLCGG